MTSSDTLFAYTENLNVWKTKQDREKLKTPFRLIGKCCSHAFKIGSMILWSQWHFNFVEARFYNNPYRILPDHVLCITCFVFRVLSVSYPFRFQIPFYILLI